MSFDILPVSLEDIPELVEVYHEAHLTLHDLFFRADTSEIPADLLVAKHLMQFLTYFDPATYWGHARNEIYKAVDKSTGTIAGWSMFCFPCDRIPQSDTKHSIRAYKKVLLASEAVTRVSRKKLREELDYKNQPAESRKACSKRMKGHRRWCDIRDDFYIDDLAVRTRYRGCGLEQRLLQPGLDIAGEIEAKVYTMTGSKGKASLFLEHGFKVVEEIKMNFGKFGSGKEFYMIREPEWETISEDSEEMIVECGGF